jgi:very-short-patch-repair endonuclease
MRDRSLAFPPAAARPSRLLGERAFEMRRAPTSSEARLFDAVRAARLGVTFRRQVPLAGRFIVDLLAAELRLVVEVDGGYHARRCRADARRDRALARAGYCVLRLDAELVMSDLPAALARIRVEIERLRHAAEG